MTLAQLKSAALEAYVSYLEHKTPEARKTWEDALRLQRQAEGISELEMAERLELEAYWKYLQEDTFETRGMWLERVKRTRELREADLREAT